MDRKRFWQRSLVQIFTVTLLVFGLYYYLTPRVPGFEKWNALEALKGLVKLFLFPLFLENPDRSFPMWQRATLFDIFIIFIPSFLIALLFFAQFTLPIQKLAHRGFSFRYLLLYALKFLKIGGPLGDLIAPPIKVENGKILQAELVSKRELERGQNVILLDTASAGVLRTGTEFTQIVGPGLVFADRGEYLAGVVDLHGQTAPIPPLGPRGEENPFAPQQPAANNEAGESNAEYQARQARRQQTSGLTRDGVEVVPNILAVFRLDPDLRPGPQDVRPARTARRERRVQTNTTHFGYNPEAVWRAVTVETVDPGKPPGAEDRLIPWTRLPSLLAVDLWREYLRRFRLDQLFPPQRIDPRTNEEIETTAFETIQAQVRARLTQPAVDRLLPDGEPAGVRMPSREFEVLRARGIRATTAVIRQPRLEEELDKKIVDQWFSYWQFRARDERAYIDLQRSYRREEGQANALHEYARRTTRDLVRSPWFQNRFLGQNAARERRDLLNLLVRSTLIMCKTDGDLHQRLAGEDTRLRTLMDWLENA